MITEKTSRGTDIVRNFGGKPEDRQELAKRLRYVADYLESDSFQDEASVSAIYDTGGPSTDSAHVWEMWLTFTSAP